MPRLTNARRERFAQELAIIGASQTAAYRRAGYTGNVETSTAASAASRLAHSPEVATRVKELQAMAARATALTRADLLDMMLEAHAFAREQANPSAAIRAAELLGKELAGMYRDRAEIGPPGSFRDLSDAELRARLASELEAAGLPSGFLSAPGRDLAAASPGPGPDASTASTGDQPSTDPLR